jgi:protein-S-isoprenylcysteine O-methyltransferase Ste14
MAIEFNSVRLAAFAAVLACWLTFILVLALRKKIAALPVTGRIGASNWGLLLEALSYVMVWALPRKEASLLHLPAWLEVFVAGLAATAAIASVLLWLWALRALGRHWALVARVVQGHKLVTNGPYGFVRNPIYLSMFGMLVATGLVVTRWWVLALAVAVFLVGNSIRVRAEEQLLRASFGPEFDDYAARVPAMFPRAIKGLQYKRT